MSNKLVDTLKVIGKEFDRIEEAAGNQPLIAQGLLQDMFPDTTFTLFSVFEQAYTLRSDGTDTTRRKRILAAIKKQGGLTKLYIERVSNTLGGSTGPYRYNFQTDSIPPPESKTIRFNALLTEIYVDNDTLNDENAQSILLEAQPNDKLYVFNDIDGDNFQSFQIGSIANQIGYTQFNISAVISSNGPSFTNNQPVCVVIGKPDSYEVKITEGAGSSGFIVHTFGPSTIPTGPATPLPGTLRDIGSIGAPFTFTVHVYDSPGLSEPDLERLINEIKGAWTEESLIYH